MKAAKRSPRIEDDGSLRWYAGDTFSLTFNFILKDINGNNISISPNDRITIQFRDSRSVIHEFQSLGTASPTVIFNEEISNKFVEGVYSICAKFNSNNVTTLLKDNRVVVE